MEGNQSNHPLFVWSQGDPRLVDVDGGVILEVSDFYEEGNPKVFFDWLHSIERFFQMVSLLDNLIVQLLGGGGGWDVNPERFLWKQQEVLVEL